MQRCRLSLRDREPSGDITGELNKKTKQLKWMITHQMNATWAESCLKRLLLFQTAVCCCGSYADFTQKKATLPRTTRLVQKSTVAHHSPPPLHLLLFALAVWWTASISITATHCAGLVKLNRSDTKCFNKWLRIANSVYCSSGGVRDAKPIHVNSNSHHLVIYSIKTRKVSPQ